MRFAVLAMAVAVAPACHYFDDEDSGSSVGPSVFQGRWTGTLRLLDGSTQDLQWQFDANSMITGVTVDSVPTNFTGSITHVAGGFEIPTAKLFDFDISDGATTENGGFYVDDRIQYGIVIYSNGDFAALEKSERSRPTFRIGDIRDQETTVFGAAYVRWTGVSEIAELAKWTIQTNRRVVGGVIPYEIPLKDPPLTVENPTGNFTNFNDQGIWEGLDIPGPGDPDPDPYPMYAIMSFDKGFVGTYECNPGFPECAFVVWVFK